MKRLLMLIVLTLSVLGCQPLTAMQTSDVLHAVGYATISEQRGDTLDEQRLRAMRASKLDAYRELTEQVYGVRLSASADMTDQMLGMETTDVAVDGLIRGAKVVRSYPVGDSYVTEMELNLELMDKLKGNSEIHKIPQQQVTLF